MKIVVCIKHVPATDAKIRVASDGVSIDESGVNFVISPFDEFAIEEAIRLREANEGSEVIVMSMGEDKTRDSIRKALAMGTDRAVFLKDEAFRHSDPLGTAKVLSKAIEKIGDVDLIFFGWQGVGTDQCQVGALVAQQLGLPHVNTTIKLEIKDGRLTAESEIEGAHEVVEAPLPAAIIAQKGLNEPRYPSLKGIMAAKKKEMLEWTAADLGLSPDEVGEKGAKAKIVKLEPPPPKPPGRMLEGDPADAARELAHLLHDERKVF